MAASIIPMPKAQHGQHRAKVICIDCKCTNLAVLRRRENADPRDPEPPKAA
jgi:hypothetical protein